MALGKAWFLNVLSGFDSTFLLSLLGFALLMKIKEQFSMLSSSATSQRTGRAVGEAVLMLSLGLTCLSRQYPKSPDLENQPFTFRELSAPSSASPCYPAPLLLLSSQGPGLLRYWMVGTGKGLYAPGIKTIKWKILTSLTY